MVSTKAETGVSDGLGRATWNYDWHVDLRNAHGVAAGTTLDDYDLTLETDIVGGSMMSIDIEALFGSPSGLVLFQSSQNPVFGNPGFDPDAADTYVLRLVLTPVTFNGPALTVEIHVVVS